MEGFSSLFLEHQKVRTPQHQNIGTLQSTEEKNVLRTEGEKLLTILNITMGKAPMIKRAWFCGILKVKCARATNSLNLAH